MGEWSVTREVAWSTGRSTGPTFFLPVRDGHSVSVGSTLSVCSFVCFTSHFSRTVSHGPTVPLSPLPSIGVLTFVEECRHVTKDEKFPDPHFPPPPYLLLLYRKRVRVNRCKAPTVEATRIRESYLSCVSLRKDGSLLPKNRRHNVLVTGYKQKVFPKRHRRL